MTSQDGNMQAISVEFGDCVDVGLIFAQKLNNIIVTLVASKMKCCVSIVIIGICIDIEFEEYFGDFQMTS